MKQTEKNVDVCFEALAIQREEKDNENGKRFYGRKIELGPLLLLRTQKQIMSGILTT